MGDAVINHMSGQGMSGKGSAGSDYDGNTLDFPGVPFGPPDFTPRDWCPSTTGKSTTTKTPTKFAIAAWSAGKRTSRKPRALGRAEERPLTIVRIISGVVAQKP